MNQKFVILTIEKYLRLYKYRFTPELMLRPFFKQLPKNKKLTGIEIGNAYGLNASCILNCIPNIKKLYLVDPHTPYYDTGFRNYKNSEKTCKKRLKRFNDKTQFVLAKSDTAIKYFKDHRIKVDFVYIDGDHSYLGVMSDLLNYVNVLNSTGVIGGHDYGKDSVSKAVFDFCNETGFSFKAKRNDWWLVNDIEIREND